MKKEDKQILIYVGVWIIVNTFIWFLISPQIVIISNAFFMTGAFLGLPKKLTK